MVTKRIGNLIKMRTKQQPEKVLEKQASYRETRRHFQITSFSKLVRNLFRSPASYTKYSHAKSATHESAISSMRET